MNIAQVIAALQGGGNPDEAVIQAFQPGGAGLPPIPGPQVAPPSSPFPPPPGSPPPAAPPAPPTTTVPTGAVTPVTNPIPAAASPNALQSPPDLANMYVQLMQQNRNAAALDSGLTMIAAGLSPYEGTRKALIAASAAGGAQGAGNITSADLINLQKQQQSMKDMLLRRSVLGGLGKQYNLSPETLVALETSGKLDEVIAAHNTGHVIKVTNAENGQESLHHAITGKEIAKIGGPKPEEGEFVEGATGRQLRSKRTGETMGPSAGLPPTSEARTNAEMLDGINAELVAAGKPKISMTEYLTTVKRDKQKAANAADIEALAQINEENAAAGKPAVGMQYFITTIKLEPREAPNAKYIASLAAINKDRPADKQMGMEEYIRRYGKSGVTVNVGPQGQKFPEPPPGQDWERADNGDVLVTDGKPKLYDLPGSDAAIKRREHALKVEKAEREEKKATEAEVVKDRTAWTKVSSVSRAVDTAKDLIKNQKSYWPATGLGSSIPAQFGSTSATNVRSVLRTVDANTAFSQLQSMRDASPQGSAGLGSVTDFEQKMLSSAFASLDPYQDDDQLLANLNHVKAAMIVLAENDFKKGGRLSDAEAQAAYEKALAKALKEVEQEGGGGKIGGNDVRRIN